MSQKSQDYKYQLEYEVPEIDKKKIKVASARFWYLSQRQAVKAQTRLHVHSLDRAFTACIHK